MPTQTRTPDRALTPRQLAHFLAVGVDKVFHWIKSGKLEAIDLGGSPGRPRYKILPDALNRFLTTKATVPERPACARTSEEKSPEGWVTQT